MKILVVNGGDRAHKLSLYDLENEEPIEPLWKGCLDWGRKNQPISLSVNTYKGAQWERNLDENEIEGGIKALLNSLPVPWEWKQKGIQRYGFHGISHQYCAEHAVKFLKQDVQKLKIINCHLGNGCSLCAIQDGKSYETTMGLTPLEGLMMGTRCGSIDPGILLYLLREEQMSGQALDQALNFASGLKGIGGSSDMRDLLGKEQKGARLTVQMFIHRLKTAIGALVVSLGGFNVLSFTGGIGENASTIREETCRGLACLNITLDFEKNRTCEPDADIAVPSSPIRVLVLHTREEWMIARACFRSE